MVAQRWCRGRSSTALMNHNWKALTFAACRWSGPFRREVVVIHWSFSRLGLGRLGPRHLLLRLPLQQWRSETTSSFFNTRIFSVVLVIFLYLWVVCLKCLGILVSGCSSRSHVHCTSIWRSVTRVYLLKSQNDVVDTNELNSVTLLVARLSPSMQNNTTHMNHACMTSCWLLHLPLKFRVSLIRRIVKMQV